MFSGTNDDYIVNGPKPIWGNWPSLEQAGFKTLDTILPHPTKFYQAYFFSGEQYALIEIKPGMTTALYLATQAASADIFRIGRYCG